MHYFNNKPNRLSEEFKASILATMAEYGLTQDQIADAIGVNRTTISRWFSYGGDLHFPACLTPMLDSKELRPLALDILRFQAQALGLHIQDAVGIEAELNGSLDDELLEIGRLEGKMIEVKDKSPRQVDRLCNEMERIVNRLRLELRSKK